MKNKAFTLIELLAVIIILGILMLIAIPSVTNYINNSRKNTYVTTVNELVKGTIAKVNSGELNMLDTDTTYYVPTTCIKLENGEPKSPYGKFDPAYVVVTFDGTNYNYYFTGKDVQNMGVPDLTSADILSKESIVSNVTSIDTTVGIEGTSNVYVFSDECNGEGEIGLAGTTVSGGSHSGGNSSSGDNEEPICKKQTCPKSITPIIYWALQDTDSDGKNDKLIISSNAVSGNSYGSFAGDVVYTDWEDVPWIGNTGSAFPPANGSSSSSQYVNKIVIEGTVVPKSTAYWFMGVGMYASPSFEADLDNLYTCHVTTMKMMFAYAGLKSKILNLNGLCSWDTSKVTNMSFLFSDAGYYTNVFDIDVSNFNTSNVILFTHMFASAGYYATTIDIDLSNWNTSNATNMSGMFYCTGENSINWSVGDISNWNTSKVTDMSSMFSFTKMNTDTYDLDISGWDLSKVTNFNQMFNYAGDRATTWNVNIPSTNRNGIINSTTTMYGESSSNFVNPPDGRTFTLS